MTRRASCNEKALEERKPGWMVDRYAKYATRLVVTAAAILIADKAATESAMYLPYQIGACSVKNCCLQVRSNFRRAFFYAIFKKISRQQFAIFSYASCSCIFSPCIFRISKRE
jgi:hypothetical protein